MFTRLSEICGRRSTCSVLAENGDGRQACLAPICFSYIAGPDHYVVAFVCSEIVVCNLVLDGIGGCVYDITHDSCVDVGKVTRLVNN